MEPPLVSSKELQATLDAAFALIDDYLTPSGGNVVAAFSQLGEQLDAQCEDASSGDSSTSSQAASSPPSSPVNSMTRLSTTIRLPDRRGDQIGSIKPPAPKRATFQVRQKQEIAQLRQETAQLEAALEVLRALTGTARADTQRAIHDKSANTGRTLAVTAGSKGSSRPELASLWKDMAARHKKLRGVSEAENMTLRLQVAEQLKAIRSIQKLLRRQATRDVEPVPRPVNAIRTDLPEARGAVMAMLSDEIDAMYRSVDVALQLCGLGTFTAVPVQENLAHPSPAVLATQLVESRLMPFNFRDVAETMWYFSASMCTNSDLFQRQSLCQRGGALFRTYEMDHRSDPGHDFTVKGNHALRRFVEPNRFIFLSSGFVRPTILRGKDVSGVFCRETGRVVISRVPQADGGASDLCCIQTCFEIVVDVQGASESGKAIAKDLRQLLVAHKLESFEFFQATLETLLLRKQRTGQLGL